MKPDTKYFEYDEPFSERYEELVEPNIKPICDIINKSGWVWTGESCEGHNPKINPTTNWGNHEILLRLIVATKNVGELFRLINQNPTPEKGWVLSKPYIHKIDKKFAIFVFNFEGDIIQTTRTFCYLLANAILKRKL